MLKAYETADDLPGQYRQIAIHFANPHSLIYDPLDAFYDFLQGPLRAGEYRRLHGGPRRCSCDVCAAKTGRPTFVLPLNGRQPEPGWVLWGDGRYLVVDTHSCPITVDAPCKGRTPGQCDCYWCSPYHYDHSLSNYRAIEKLMTFIAPLVPAARGARLERERADLLARLANVEQELGERLYQPGLI